MSIRIRQQSWDRAAQELGGLDAEQAAEALRDAGHDVEIIEGDWGVSYYADSSDEHDAVMAFGEE